MMAMAVAGVRFERKKIEAELDAGFSQATEIADALARKGVPFRDAHAIVGKLVAECQGNGTTLGQARPLPQLSGAEWKAAISLERPGLARKVAVPPEAGRMLDAMEKRIGKAYAGLLV